MAEHGARSRGEHGRHAPAVEREGRVSDRVDAPMDAMKRAPARAVLDTARTQPKRSQLCDRDDAVLLHRNRRDPLVQRRWQTLTTPGVVFYSHRPSMVVTA